MNDYPAFKGPRVYIRTTGTREAALSFLPLLQEGFRVLCTVNISLYNLLTGEFHLSADYAAQRISTVFLDGLCVDDLSNTIVNDGSTIALSSAMPGLAGAALRRKGVLESLRNAISYKDKPTGKLVPSKGSVTVKLFNVTITELGPAFLENGIVLSARRAGRFFGSLQEHFWKAVIFIEINGTPVKRDQLPEAIGNAHSRDVFLRVEGDRVPGDSQ